MTKKYQKRRPQQRKTYTRSESKPWNWLVVGLLLGCILPGIIVLKLLRHHDKQDNQKFENHTLALDEEQKVKHHKISHKTSSSAKKNSSHPSATYEFYDMLSNEEKEVPASSHRSISAKDSSIKKNYVLQIASFKTFTEADHLKAELIVMGYDVFISKIKQKDINWNRVNIGPYDSLSDVQRTKKDLQEHNIQSIIVEMN